MRGPLSNLEKFWEAFDVKAGDKMRRSGDQIVTIWQVFARYAPNSARIKPVITQPGVKPPKKE